MTGVDGSPFIAFLCAIMLSECVCTLRNFTWSAWPGSGLMVSPPFLLAKFIQLSPFR